MINCIMTRNYLKNNGAISIVFITFRTKSKLKLYKIVCENKDFCNAIMSSTDDKRLKFNKYQKFDKGPFIIEKIDDCNNHPENSSTKKSKQMCSISFSNT